LEDQEAGYVTVTRNPDGSVFDWGQTPAGRLFHVRESDDRPNHAAMAINWRSSVPCGSQRNLTTLHVSH
jgi:hypothetical protein